jgi:hypothetical protein
MHTTQDGVAEALVPLDLPECRADGRGDLTV